MVSISSSYSVYSVRSKTLCIDAAAPGLGFGIRFVRSFFFFFSVSSGKVVTQVVGASMPLITGVNGECVVFVLLTLDSCRTYGSAEFPRRTRIIFFFFRTWQRFRSEIWGSKKATESTADNKASPSAQSKVCSDIIVFVLIHPPDKHVDLWI